jgi:hypothetical protein
MTKYSALQAMLGASSRDVLEMEFTEIAALVGGLPKSAYRISGMVG